MIKKLLLFIALFLSFGSSSFAAQILVENVFSDITENYQYRDELQALYDRGMIIPDESGRFNPNAFLNRDEFVGIAMEVICERCISPHTEYRYIEQYFGADIYFDVRGDNKYFYCIAEADRNNYVRGYDLGESCQNGTNRPGERPFCPLNRINREEAVAVLLRNSGIFTIEDNRRVVADINAGQITEIIGNDVQPTDIDGNPYTFYGYLRRALTYQITEYDIEGNERILNLLEPDVNGNINPGQSITKEEFLRMSYIALKSNNCSDVRDNGLALGMNIWEQSCSSGDTNCTRSDLSDPENTYDFEPVIDGVCDGGIEDPTGYIWRFQNLITGQQDIVYGPYLDNYTLQGEGEWRVYLRVVDVCGNTSEIYSTIFVSDPVSQEIDVDIDVYDDSCRAPGTSCQEIEFGSEEDDGDNIFDFDGDVFTTCSVGSISYNWTFVNTTTGDRYSYSGEYIDDILLGRAGVWNIVLDVVDGCGNTGREEMTYIVEDDDNPDFITDLDVDIDVFDDDCDSSRDDCTEIEFENEEDDGDDIFDFDADIESSFDTSELIYLWTFTHSDSGTTVTFTTEYVNDFYFSEPGVWDISLSVTDPDGNTGTEVMTYIVFEDNAQEIDVDIDVYDDSCVAPGNNCTEIDFDEENPDNDIFDFDGDISTSCNSGEILYSWEFFHRESGRTISHNTEYVDDFIFEEVGIWEISLDVVDGCGNTGREEMIYIVDPENTSDIDVDIDVYDDDCNSTLNGCLEIEFDEEDPDNNIFDFEADIQTNFDSSELTYLWTFTHSDSGTSVTFTTEYVDDFYFSEPGVWDISLSVIDPDGNTGTESMTYIVSGVSEDDDIVLDVTIIADPLYGYEDLTVNFNGDASGGQGPYTYNWNFGDGETGFGEVLDHIYDTDGVFSAELIVTDVNGNVGTATVVIVVLEADSCLEDTDGDSIMDCDDACPLIPGPSENSGCPILERGCDVDCGCPDGYTCSDSDPLTCGTGICEPSFDIGASCLYNPLEGSIFGSALCTTCPCNTYVDFLADVRRCDLIFPAITSPDGREIYSRGNTWQIQ